MAAARELKMSDEKRETIPKDLKRVSRNKYIYLVAGLVMFALGVALFVYFIVGRNVPALLLGCVGFVWGALLLNQALRSRDLEDLIDTRLREMESRESGSKGESSDAAAVERAGSGQVDGDERGGGEGGHR